MATAILQSFGTPIVFQDSGGDADITLINLAAAAGRISAPFDRGAGSIATWYMCRAKIEKGVASVVNQVVAVHLATSDGTNVDGNVGTVDAALTAAVAASLPLIVPILITSTSTNTAFTSSGPIWIPTRYFSVGVMNSATGLLRNTSNSCVITFTPISDEIQ
jgi:hypothetical protein